ncbi:MAG: prevent-host-death family protein [Chlamydiia bacterium]|nr:prevent-host-death family protein [Chlamydiia bacterium]
MKREVGSFEAKTHLPKLLEAVLQGDRITITRRGERIAQLIPMPEAGKKEVQSVIADLRSWRQGISWGTGKGMLTQSAREEGRR